jgi:hypothetical protein
MSASRARSTAPVASPPTRSDRVPGGFPPSASAAARGRPRFAAPRAVRNDLAEAGLPRSFPARFIRGEEGQALSHLFQIL